MTDTTFTYRTSAQHERTSVLTRTAAEQLADLFAVKGISSPFSTADDLPYPLRESRFSHYETYLLSTGKTPSAEDRRLFTREPIRAWEYDPETYAVCRELPDSWELDVSQVQGERAQAAYNAKRRATYEAQKEPIRSFLLAELDAGNDRYMRDAEPRDLTDLAKTARQDRRQTLEVRGKKTLVGPMPYAPESGCSAKLHLKDAVCYAYEQASYADHSRYAVPVTIEAGADPVVCRRNLGRFMEALRTHNGYAGSGCTWSAELRDGFVLLDCRASISD